MSDRILVGTRKGLFRIQRDASGRWEIAQSWFLGDGVSSLLPQGSRTLHAALHLGHFGAKLQRSDDAGASWELIGSGLRGEYLPDELAGDPLAQDPHRIVQCPARPDRLWMQHHNGIFVSDDGGVHWRELKDVVPSGFGFAVGVHPQDPDIAWFVPATKDENRYPVDGRLVVTRTRNGGEDFEVIDRGLPQEPAYDLVYRHGLDCAADGERLAFGSTTGSLWVSEDQGDSWACISQHLPPILCVRFEPAAP